MSQYEKKQTLLKAINICLSFKDKVVLKDINFEVKDVVRPDVTQGQVISLLGRSGVGKSQLIRIISGLPIPGGTLTGQVLVNVEQKPVQAGDMGIVPQDYYLPEHLRIIQSLNMAALKNPALKKDPSAIKAAIDNYVVWFELQEHIDKFPIQLSGGQKQRASISMQLLNGSDFLLMDEPFSGLDPVMIDKTTELLLKISQMDELKTIFIVSHDLRNSVAISDTVYILSHGGRKPDEGATIVKEIDLMERGLAWHPEVKQMAAFRDTLKEIKELL